MTGRISWRIWQISALPRPGAKLARLLLSDRPEEPVRLVVAIGRSVLLPRGVTLPADATRSAVRDLARHLARLAATHELVVAFGSGPQPALLSLEGAAHAHQVEHKPLELQAAHGEITLVYLLEQALRELLPLDQMVASMLMTVAVDAADAAFESPDTAVGPAYLRDEALQLARRKGWVFRTEGEQWRRVVSRPVPNRIVELRAVERLLEAGAVVIAAGGGGLPVPAAGGSNRLGSVGCLVECDLAAETLARDLDADMLILLADGDAVYLDWGTPWQRAIRRASPDCLSDRLFHQGSIAGKIAAACRFVVETGRTAAIGAPDDLDRILTGTAGTIVSGSEPALVMAEAKSTTNSQDANFQ
jgi:carbamate kinase